MRESSEDNPWRSIPPDDYEAHMGDSGAKQLSFLSSEFKQLLDSHQPETVAILGCATGNGLEHVGNSTCRQVIGIDIHPEYIEITRQRYSDQIANLQLFCSDIKNIELAPRSVDLVWCGLFFEHVDPKLSIGKIRHWLKRGGVLATVLQLPGELQTTVTSTGIESLKLLEPTTRLIEPDQLNALVKSAGFNPLEDREETLVTGKRFRALSFQLKP